MQLGQSLGGDLGRQLMSRASRSLAAFARYSYEPSENLFYAIISDGRRIRPEDIKRPGYFFEPGNELREVKMRPVPPNPTYFWAYALAYRHTGDPAHRDTLNQIGRTFDVGTLGTADAPARLNLQTDCLAPEVLLAFLEIYRRDQSPACLAMARRIGDNILARNSRGGWLLSGPHRRNIQFDALAPLALLHLAAAIDHRESDVPLAWATRADMQLNFDGRGKIWDTNVLWDVDQPRK